MMASPVHNPFVEGLGLELTEMQDGQASMRLRLRDDHLNSWAVAHGGVVMTLLDVVMAHAARSVNQAESGHGPGAATVEMKTSFMRPATGALRAHGKLLHRTPGMAFCEASVFNEHGELCAHATGTFKYLRALPARGREIKSLRRRTEEPPSGDA
jgi:uncharacterized protein (TIGR00369 family)